MLTQRRSVCAGAASLRASSSDVFPPGFVSELQAGSSLSSPESVTDGDNPALLAARTELRVPAVPETAAPRTAVAAPPAAFVREPLHVHVAAEAPAAEAPAGDDRGKKISHKRGRSLSSLVPRLIGRRASATGDELNVCSTLPTVDARFSPWRSAHKPPETIAYWL